MSILSITKVLCRNLCTSSLKLVPDRQREAWDASELTHVDLMLQKRASLAAATRLGLADIQLMLFGYPVEMLCTYAPQSRRFMSSPTH
jgi:hypothetical protein